MTILTRRGARRAILAASVALPSSAAFAQERLVGARTASAGVSIESWSFGDGGARQPGLGAGTDARVRSAWQLTLPVAVAVPIGTRWTADLATAHVTGVVTLAPDGTGASEHLTLGGLTDVRVRAVGRIVGDNVLVTLGATLPTGRSSLDPRQLGALRVLAAPALALPTAAVTAGAGGTAGLVLARRVGAWALATGASYELRGAHQPITAIAAGAATDDGALRFDPGDAAHLSLGADRLVGQSRTTLGLTLDLFGVDRLRVTPTVGDARIRLGPVVGAEWQLTMVPGGLRELRLYAIDRYRMPYTRDGARESGSGGNYLDAGISALWPLARATSVLTALDGRHHTGLGVDETFATARVLAGGLTLGIVHDVAGYRVQPVVHARRARIGTSGPSARAVGFGAAVSVARRF